eukprot:CAMPEP_0181047898 /NCGR_PEP_ID=MMETSP1070-20121207/15134_1 /TAXON_ID=265543 /ORGANISM="Minutocellus polymorphus, Strain NH13" /LENGTH=322 /DNA_ID=CAMNT_0023126619 /DNA_START=111 /DNA_END=1079 /DNA_ORIENTATION=-
MIKPQLIPRHAAVGLAIAFCFFVVVLVGAEEDLLLSPTGTDQQQPHKASAAASAASASFANTDDLLWFHTTTTRAVDILAKARRRDVIIASASAGASWAKTTPGSTTSAAEGGLRFLAESESSDSCDDKLKKCRGALDMCRDGEAANAGPSYLFVQMAQTCKLKEKTDSKGEAYYELSSKDMDDDTYIFIDRPYRTAGTVKTKQFFNDFDTTFSTETGGKPNGVITFRHRNTDNFEGPLMSVFVKAARHKDSGKYVYKLSQSKEQEETNGLKDFFREGDGKDYGVVEYEMCSIFIDSVTRDPGNEKNWDELFKRLGKNRDKM